MKFDRSEKALTTPSDTRQTPLSSSDRRATLTGSARSNLSLVTVEEAEEGEGWKDASRLSAYGHPCYPPRQVHLTLISRVVAEMAIER